MKTDNAEIISEPTKTNERISVRMGEKLARNAKKHALMLGETFAEFVQTAVRERIEMLACSKPSANEQIATDSGLVEITPAIRRLAIQMDATPEDLAQDILFSGAMALDNAHALNNDIELNPIHLQHVGNMSPITRRWTLTDILDSMPHETIRDYQKLANRENETIQAVIYREMIDTLPSE